jgi:hypothetical protein
VVCCGQEMMVAHGYWTALKIVPISFWGFLIELRMKDDGACGTYGLEQCVQGSGGEI